MKLDRTTYEAWLLDRIEGHLTPSQERELDAFLAANPDLSAPPGELPVVSEEALPFDLKAELKKSFPPTGEPDASRLNDFLAARLEGDLDQSQEQALDRFLYEHPEHEQDAKRMAVSKVSEGSVPFERKPSIERHFPPQGLPDKHRLTDFLIAAQEGDLTSEQRKALDVYMATHPEAQREQRLIAAARMQGERVVYFGKERLKKREGRVVMMWPRYAAAASIALLLGLAWWLLRDGSNIGPEIARQEQVEPAVVPVPNEEEIKAQPQEPLQQTQREQAEENEHVPAPIKSIPSLRSKDERDGTQEPAPKQKSQPLEQEAPVPDPQLANKPAVGPQQPSPEPVLAQDPVQPQQPELVKENAPALAANAQQAVGGTPIGVVLANTVRNDVLETEERTTGLDRNDALAMVDKGLNAITGGEGGVQVQRTGTRERLKLRLGRGLAISASRGR